LLTSNHCWRPPFAVPGHHLRAWRWELPGFLPGLATEEVRVVHNFAWCRRRGIFAGCLEAEKTGGDKEEELRTYGEDDRAHQTWPTWPPLWRGLTSDGWELVLANLKRKRWKCRQSRLPTDDFNHHLLSRPSPPTLLGCLRYLRYSCAKACPNVKDTKDDNPPRSQSTNELSKITGPAMGAKRKVVSSGIRG